MKNHFIIVEDVTCVGLLPSRPTVEVIATQQAMPRSTKAGIKKICCCLIVALALLLISACNNNDVEDVVSDIHFTQLNAVQTGINFTNTITESDSVNLLTNEYLYTGGGVGIGDFNNDGLQDVFFSGNQTSCKLYINKGNFKFEDATIKAGLQTNYWATGVSIVDINNDGFADIYVCASGSKDPNKRSNKLYINNHNLTFTEEAGTYGLADTSYSTQAVFFDYDNDGDLDMYLLNHQLYNLNPNTVVAPDDPIHKEAADKLFENTGIAANGSNPVFIDVSAKAGIKEFGYGLGIVVSDVNNDNYPDVYVANDYVANDVLWLNNKNGTFTNCIAEAVKHTSYSSMGVDAADINNDGLPDVLSLDMQPATNERQKMMFSFLTNERYEIERRAGYQPAFMRNMLQVNNGVRNMHDAAVPFFSEVGQLAGIAETDWSWSVLMADLNNDGKKDIHITNGMGRDMLNKDFVAAFKNDQQTASLQKNDIAKTAIEKLDKLGEVDLKNYCFRNNGNLGFTNVSKQAGLDVAGVSNGCAYADLDNDGDLDLVVNNINKEAFVFKNDACKNASDTGRNFLTIQLQGNSGNSTGFGAKVFVYTNLGQQCEEQNPVRGYMSSVDQRLHFGVGNAASIDSFTVTWSNAKTQTIKNIKANTTLVLQQANAKDNYVLPQQHSNSLFVDVTNNLHVDFKHAETYFNDFDFQRLLPQKFSQLGPFITTGDVNSDGLSDFFVGGAYNQSGKIFSQNTDGTFTAKDLEGNKEQEDLGCLFFDADGDKDLDLFINSGGYEFDIGSQNYMPRLYLNDGKGNFTFSKNAMPKGIFTSAQSVAAADFDGDGDLDLFVGGRVSPNNFPVAPHSYLLQNNNGVFSDVTAEVCPQLEEPGMITAAVWADLNNDKLPELIIAGEWMPLRIFQNNAKGKLEELTASANRQLMQGQWRSLCIADLNKDGKPDIIAGNIGTNNYYKASEKHPIKLFAKDIDGNGSIDPILAYYRAADNGTVQLYPAINRDQYAEQVPTIKKKYLYNKDFSSVTVDQLFGNEDRDDMIELTCNETRSCWFENTGDAKFIMHPLPVEAQFAPVNAIASTDVDSDGNVDLILAGNEYASDVMQGRSDASYGVVLKGDGKGNFTAIKPAASGLIIDGDVKDVKLINTPNQRLLITAINNENLKLYQLK